jgi:UDP-N-acetylmuramyl tripeptide synthase
MRRSGQLGKDLEGGRMAEEDTRKILRTFGVTVTNFEEHTAQLLEQAKQLRQAGESEGMLTLLKDFAGELLDLQGRWLEITNHILSRQRQVLTDIATLVSEWERKST